MKMINLRFLLAAFAAFFIAGSAVAQTTGTVTSRAFAIGKGAGQTGFTSLLCAATEVAIGQSAANPACHALSGDVTMTSGGVVAIGAGKVTNSMLAGSIAASKLVGTDIATVGTVTAGTWQATPVAVTYGGTGAATANQARTNLGVVIGTNVQAWDADLDCLAALATGGVVARTGAGTCATRTVTAPAAGITVSNGDGAAGNPTLVLANDLAALEGLGSTGFAARTGADSWAQRSIGGTANEIAVANGDGVAGNPVVSLPSALTFTGKTVTGGTFASPQINTPTGIVKGDVGLGNVDNTSDATKWAASATLTNKTINCANNTCTVRLPNDVTGALQAANFPALTGDVTTSAGSLATSIGAGKVTSSMLNADVYSTAHSWSAAQTFSGGLNNSGARRDSTQTAPAQITANQNDYNPSSAICATTTTLLVSSDAARDITGFGGGAAGCDLYLFNAGSFSITLKDDSTSSSAPNRLDLGADFVLASKAAAHLKYDGVASRWRNITGSGGGGGGGSGTVTSVTCNGGATTITTSGTCASREILTADRTYYVATSGGGGSDSNDGLSSGTPFLTGQKAINVVAALDLSIYNVTIQFANGSYTGNINALPWVGSGTVTLRGDPTTPGNVSINGRIRSSRGTKININGLKMTATSGTQIYVDGGYIYTLNVEGAGGVDFMSVTEQGFGLIGGSWKISGNYSTVLSAGYNSQLTTWGTTLTLAGTPAWSIAFLYMTANGSMNGASMTFAGTGATGPRYNISGNSVCMTAGGSSYFPGNFSGTTTTGGQYL